MKFTQLLFPQHFGGHFGMGVVFIEIAPNFFGCFPMMMGHQGKKKILKIGAGVHKGGFVFVWTYGVGVIEN
jgi:hypothetical protein